jgi:AcrR family transcriptional regulator
VFKRASIGERKNHIAGIAPRVFSRKGHITATVQDITNELNISKARLCHYFRSKEDLLNYILISNTDRFIRVLKDHLMENKEKRLDPITSSRNLIRTYANYIYDAHDCRLILLRERHQLIGKNKAELLKRERIIYHLLKKEFQKVSTLKKSYDPSVISFLFIAMCHWIGYWLKESGKLTKEEAINQGIDIVFYGISERD